MPSIKGWVDLKKTLQGWQTPGALRATGQRKGEKELKQERGKEEMINKTKVYREGHDWGGG